MDRVEDFILKAHYAYGFSSGMLEANKYLTVSLVPNNGMLEIPDVWIYDASSMLSSDYTSFCLALVSRGSLNSRRLIKGALSDFMLAPRRHDIGGVHMTCGATYYGIPGIIFDSNFDPLLMMTYTVIEEEFKLKLIRHNCRISPKVFDNPNNIVEKTIIKKILPFCAAHREIGDSEFTYDPYVSAAMLGGTTIKVIVDDINKDFIRTIAVPKIGDNREKEVHRILSQCDSNI